MNVCGSCGIAGIEEVLLHAIWRWSSVVSGGIFAERTRLSACGAVRSIYDAFARGVHDVGTRRRAIF